MKKIKKQKKMSVEDALISGLQGALEYERGERKLKTSVRGLPDPAPQFTSNDIQKLRKSIFDMTQQEFAVVLNIQTGTLRSWEQGTRKPADSALRLLQLLRTSPQVVKKNWKR